MTQTAFVGLGSNMDAEANLTAAVRLLDAHPHLSLDALSPVYRTPPWGPVPQDDYLNAVAALRTDLSAPDLLDVLLELEAQCGRVRTVRWGPRTLDLDLLIAGEVVLASERLTLPHPRLHERAFVLVPLCDLAPDLPHPALGHSMRELLARLPAGSVAEIVRTDVSLQRPPPR